VTTTTPTSTNNKTTKVKRPKEDMFCVFMLFFCPSFVLWWVLFFRFPQIEKFFNHQESSSYIQIKHKREFLLHKKRLHHNLSFLNSKGKREKYKYVYKKKCIVSVNVLILNG
jgi:hypothetical protein